MWAGLALCVRARSDCASGALSKPAAVAGLWCASSRLWCGNVSAVAACFLLKLVFGCHAGSCVVAVSSADWLWCGVVARSSAGATCSFSWLLGALSCFALVGSTLVGCLQLVLSLGVGCVVALCAGPGSYSTRVACLGLVGRHANCWPGGLEFYFSER